MTVAEYSETVEGHQLREQIHLDGIRWLGTVIAKSAGAKKIKKPQDMMKLPLIDDEATRAKITRLKEFLEQQKAAV